MKRIAISTIALITTAIATMAVPAWAGKAYFGTVGNTIAVVDTEDGTTLDEWTVPARPEKMARGVHHLWVAQRKHVLGLDPASGFEAARVPGFKYVSDMATRGGKLYIADRDSYVGGLTRLDETTLEVEAFFGSAAVTQVALGEEGFVCVKENTRLYKLDEATLTIQAWTRCTSTGTAMAYGGGSVYVLLSPGNAVARYDAETLRQTGTAYAVSGRDLAWDEAQGRVVVLEAIGGLAYPDFTRGMCLERVTIDAGSNPKALKVDAKGRRAVAKYARYEAALLDGGEVVHSPWVGQGAISVAVEGGDSCPVCGEDHGEAPRGQTWCHQHGRWHPKDHALVGGDETARGKK